MNLNGKIAVITGAASGIGRALALQLAKDCAGLALCDLQEEALAETVKMVEEMGIKVYSQTVDVAKREAVENFAAEVLKAFGQVDILINNAGVALGKHDIDEISYENLEWILGINLWGVIHGTKSFLPALKKRPKASLVNISSLFGLIGVGYQVPYCTTKYAVRGFSEAMRVEAAERYPNVKVLSVHPGGIQTRITRNSRWQDSFSEEEKKLEQEKFEKFFVHTAEKAASQIIRAMRKEQSRVMVGYDAKLLDWMSRRFPKFFMWLMGRMMVRRSKRI